MNVDIIFGVVFLAVLILLAYTEAKKKKRIAQMSPEEREVHLAKLEEEKLENKLVNSYGHKNVALVCPHCQAKGHIRIKAVKMKKGISGGKATAALLTGGWSLLVTGLSRKEQQAQAHCEHCGTTWHVV